MAKIKALSKEEIEAKKAEFEEQIKSSSEKAKLGRVSPATEFLIEIKDLVKQALDSNVTYAQISKDIYSVYNFKVGVQTLRVFAQNSLGVEKKTRAKNKTKTTATATETEKVLSTTTDDKSLSAKELKKQQTNQKQDEDSL